MSPVCLGLGHIAEWPIPGPEFNRLFAGPTFGDFLDGPQHTMKN
jgi:hypothetical protein